MTVDVGARLQSVRKLKGLSQRELAKRVGVTNSTISLIEQNRVSPSVGSLKKVLDGIPMSMADFFTLDQDQGAAEKVFFSAEEQPNLGSGSIDYFLIGAGVNDRQMEILREVMPPGSDTGEELLNHDGEEGGVVIQGRLLLTVAGETRELGPGEGYYFESRKPHHFRSVGEEDLILISANTPPTF